MRLTADNKVELIDARPQAQFVDALSHIVSAPSQMHQRVIAVPGKGGRLPLVVTIRPVANKNRHVFCDAVASLIIAPIRRSKPIDTQILSALFALTPTEARVAGELARGELVGEIADAHGVTTNTIRMQLKAIYEKTGTHRQTELVSLLANHLSLVRPCKPQVIR